MTTRVQRKLTTILAADAVGYSRAMEADEVGTLEALRAARNVFYGFIKRREGRIVNTAGDGLIAEFPSVVEAVQCAIEVQQELSSFNSHGALRFRIGIHLGDVIVDGVDLLGEGVNLASRLESMAEPGGVLISRQVYDQVQHKLSVGFEYVGEKRPKNYAGDVSVYRLSLGNDPLNAPHPTHRVEPSRQTETVPPTRNALHERVVRHAKLLGTLAFILLIVDLITGSPLWAHWPGLIMATIVALEAAPLFTNGWFKIQYARGAVILAALLMVNLFSWTGYLWVIWPAGALFVIELLRRLSVRTT